MVCYILDAAPWRTDSKAEQMLVEWVLDLQLKFGEALQEVQAREHTLQDNTSLIQHLDAFLDRSLDPGMHERVGLSCDNKLRWIQGRGWTQEVFWK